MNLTRVLFLIGILCGVAAAPVPAQPAPFRDGETIFYTIDQMGLKVGDATLTFQGLRPLDDGRQGVLIIFRADGFNFLDEERIYLDPATYRPMVVRRNLNIFGKKEQITEDYRANENKVVVTKLTGGQRSVQELVTGGPVDNLYGFIFRYRKTGSFRQGDRLGLQLPTMRLSLAIQKYLRFNAAGRSYEACYMVSQPSKYKIWFDVGPGKLPLRIAGAIGIANTKMEMVDYRQGH